MRSINYPFEPISILCRIFVCRDRRKLEAPLEEVTWGVGLISYPNKRSIWSNQLEMEVSKRDLSMLTLSSP